MTSYWTLLHTGPWLCFRAFWDTQETITQSKRVRFWRRFACIFFSVIMRFTSNISFLAWFFSFFKHFGKGPLGVYMSVWQNIHYFTEQLVIHECKGGNGHCHLVMTNKEASGHIRNPHCIYFVLQAGVCLENDMKYAGTIINSLTMTKMKAAIYIYIFV